MKNLGLTDREFVHTVIRKRPRDIHKGDCGRVLLICGSEEMAGAAIFATRSAIKSGSGLVYTCTAREIFPVLQISVPEGICKSWDKVKENLMQYDAIAIGPGLGIPRAASVPCEMAVAPYLSPDANATLWMVAYSMVFFLIAFCLGFFNAEDGLFTLAIAAYIILWIAMPAARTVENRSIACSAIQ